MASLHVRKQWESLSNDYTNNQEVPGPTVDSRWTFVQPPCQCHPQPGVFTIRSSLSSDNFLDTTLPIRWSTSLHTHLDV